MTAVEFNPDGSSLVVGNDHGVVERWTLDKWRSMGKAEGPRGTGAITKIAPDKKGRAIAIATASGQVWLWDSVAQALDKQGGATPGPYH